MIVKQKSGMNWKPLMSKAEAKEYTTNSYYQRQDFYHGTSAEAADRITAIGARWKRNSENSYGDGFYMTPFKTTAIEYASDSKDPTVLSIMVSCSDCKYNNFDGGCTAFPQGIPFRFTAGKPHLEPTPNQGNDIVFEWIDRLEQRARMKKIVADRKVVKV